MSKAKETVRWIKIGKLSDFFMGRYGILSIKDEDRLKEGFKTAYNEFEKKLQSFTNRNEVENCKVNVGFKSFKEQFEVWGGSNNSEDKIENFKENWRKYFAELYAKCINCCQFISISKKRYRPDGKEKPNKPQKIDGETAQWATTVIRGVVTLAVLVVLILSWCGMMPKNMLGMINENPDASFYIIEAATGAITTVGVFLVTMIFRKKNHNFYDSMYQKYSVVSMKFMLYLWFPRKTPARDKGLASNMLIWKDEEAEREYLNLAGYYRLDISTSKQGPSFGIRDNECVYISERSFSEEVKNQVLTSGDNNEKYIKKEYWDVLSPSLTFGTAIIIGDLLQSDKFDEDVLKKLREKLVDCNVGYKESGVANAIMAKSIKDSLYGSDIKSVKEFSKQAQNRCFYFISAITYKHDKDMKPTDERTLDYYVAQKLVAKLGKDHVFWWENEIGDNASGWPISTKIAMGLGFSTVFIGLAFDSIEGVKDSTNRYTYKCLLDDDRAYKKPAYFKHEVETFVELTTGKKKSKKFVKGIVPNGQFKSLVPQERYPRFYTLGQPDDGKYDDYPALKNYNHVVNDKIAENFRRIVEDHKKSVEEKAAEIANIIYKDIQEFAPQQPAQTTNNPGREAYKYLYDPFDPTQFEAGKYCDNFLSDEWCTSWLEHRYFEPSALKKSLKENIEVIPRDYRFEYAVIDEAGKNAKNHFLVFPERYNDDEGNFKWRIKLVVRDWNLRAIVDAGYRNFLLGNVASPLGNMQETFPLSKYSGLRFYEGKWDFNFEGTNDSKHVTCQVYSDRDGGGQNLDEDNHCAFILREDMLNASSPSYFLDGALQCVSTEDSRNFYIALKFYPKPGIQYKAHKQKSVLPRHQTGMRCPYCGRTRTDDANLQGDGEILERKNKWRKTNKINRSDFCYSEPFEIKGMKGKYRSCEYNFIGRIYRFDNNEEKIIRNEKKIIRSGQPSKSSGQQSPEELFLYGDYSEEGAFGEYNIGLSENNNRSYKRWTETHPEDKKQYQNSLVISDAPGLRALPDDDEKLIYEDHDFIDSIVITMVGISSAGKSTFISRMLGVSCDGAYEDKIDKRDVKHHIVDDKYYWNGDITRKYLKNAMKPFVTGDIAPIKVITKKMSTHPTATDPIIIMGINVVRLLEDYGSPKYQSFLSSTQNEQCDPVLTHIPFAFELKGIQSNLEKSVIVSFFDLPGGLFEGDNTANRLQDLHKDYTMLYRSDCVILLLNDEQDQKQLGLMMQAIGEVTPETIVAVVFCKADELFGKYTWEHIRNSSPVAKDTKFGGSKRQDYIDRCSEEIENTFKNASEGGQNKIPKGIQNAVNAITEKFNNYKFFATSALGRGDSLISTKIDANGKFYETYTLYETSPLNIENVLLWIMYEKGIIE